MYFFCFGLQKSTLLILLLEYFKVLGVSLITVGIIIRIDDALYEYTKALDMERYYTGSYLCMIIGVFIMIIGFLGCLGAAIESPCLIVFVRFKKNNL